MAQRDGDLLALLALDLDHHFKQLVLTYQHQLYAFALRMTRDPQEAEDIVQEAFIRAYFALKDYSLRKIEVVKLRPWLYKTTLHVFYNRVRKPSLPLVMLDDSEDSAMLEIEDEQSAMPEKEVERTELRRELNELIGSLPERYRAALIFYYFEEFSYAEIAELLSQPVGTVKANIHRGINLLRKILATQNAGR